MTTRIEDVLLQMGEVRYKKGDGTLYVMNERLAWMAENRDTVAVSHRFADIKMQKISPEGKPKVQLQVVLHDGNSSTFHFVNRNGQKAMLEDRDKVKELLQQLLPNFKRQVNKELEEKNRLLVENPTLLQLYKDLVTTKVLTSEEFWENHARDHAMNTVTKKQDIGVSADFLADIKPQTDGCNGLKYNLNADIIQCIFKTYPAVKRKYIENVPIKMSESDFWTKFFQSHYFHRDRITTGTKDIFTECGKIDEQTLKVDLQRDAGDPLLDIRQFQDITLEEGFGGTDERHISNSGNIVHQNMIKRFNQHSFMVLKTCADVNDSGSAKGPLTTSGAKDAGTSVAASEMPKCSKSKHDTTTNTSNSGSSSNVDPTNRKRVMEKIYYEDLGQPLLEKDTCAEVNPRNVLVGLDKAKYLGGPLFVNNYEANDDLHQSEEMQCNLKRSVEASLHRQPYKLLINPTAAVNALGELSPGGAMMRGFQEEATAHLVPDEFEKDLRNLYLTLSELLKHFWACFPPTTRELQEKVVRTHESLQRFQMAKVVPFESRVLHELSPLGSSLTQHLNRLLQAANTKFARWKERKMRQHR